MSSALAIFETIELRNGRPFALTRHLQRLRSAAARLKPLPVLPEDQELAFEIEQFCQAWGTEPGRLRVTFSDTLTLAVSAMTVQRSPIALSTSSFRFDPDSAVAGLKTSGYAQNVALLAATSETAEVLFANLHGNLCSGALSNVFVVLDGQLHTPDLGSGCRPGVTRELLLEALAGTKYPVRESAIRFSELQRAEELFVVSTFRQVQPVYLLDLQELPAHRPITEFAQACFDQTYGSLIDP